MKYDEIILGVLLILIGICGSQIYNLVIYDLEVMEIKKDLNNTVGLWIEDIRGSEVERVTNEYNSQGNWVCINIKDISYKRAVEVCKHEVGHEIYNDYTKDYDSNESEEFAEICEDDIDKCLENVS